MHFSPVPDEIYLKNISTVQIYNTESYHALSYFVEILYVGIFQVWKSCINFTIFAFLKKPCFVSLPF